MHLITLPGGTAGTHDANAAVWKAGRIRVAGQTDWKRMWMVVSAASPSELAKERMSSLSWRCQNEDLPTRPLLTLEDVTQAFAVYPECPELTNRGMLMKLEGLLGNDSTAGGTRGREGWLLTMLELGAGNTQAPEMLKWLVALHDAFELYGRPKPYTWETQQR